MTINIRQLAHDLIIPAVIASVCLVVALLGEPVSDWLRYDAVEIAQHEYWRLLTPHIVHLSQGHLIMNILGLFLVFLFFARCVEPHYWLISMLLSAFGISLLIYLFNEDIRWYVGLSGVLHTLFMLGGLADIRVRRWEGITFTLLICGKIFYEQLYGPLPGSEETAGGAVLVDAHMYGAIIGGIAGLLYLRLKKRSSQDPA